jgi:crotonobetainyl-CoA:carnitine CoA-transferase CaiB-like acyl-CoA transferase
MEVSPKRRRLLDGIRVLDFTRFLAGPYLTRVLGVMGADVIKIERPPHGDEQRGHPHFVQGQSDYFLQQNHDKRGLCMDLKRPEAQAVARDLTAEPTRRGPDAEPHH